MSNDQCGGRGHPSGMDSYFLIWTIKYFTKNNCLGIFLELQPVNSVYSLLSEWPVWERASDLGKGWREGTTS